MTTTYLEATSFTKCRAECGFEPDSIFAQELFDYETFFAQLLAVEFATRVTS